MHSDVGPAVQAHDVGAARGDELRGTRGIDSHHRGDARAVAQAVESERGDDASRAGQPRRRDRQVELLERGLGLDHDGVDAGFDQSRRLLREGRRHSPRRLGPIGL